MPLKIAVCDDSAVTAGRSFSMERMQSCFPTKAGSTPSFGQPRRSITPKSKHTKKRAKGGASIKQVLPATETSLLLSLTQAPALRQKEYGQFCSYSFSHTLPARCSVLYRLGVLSGGDKPSPVGEGGPRQRWMRSCFVFRTPHPSAFGCHLPPPGKAFCSPRKLIYFS